MTLLLVGLLPSCISYHNTNPSQLSRSSPQDLRLTMSDNTKLVLLQAVLHSDTIRGVQLESSQTRTPRSVAVSDLQGIEVRTMETGVTAAVGLAVLGGLFIAVGSSIDVP
jgi:hypothetical protein